MFWRGERVKKRTTRRYIITETPSKPKRRPWEFKKKLAAWAAILATTTAVASYILAAFDKQSVSDVTICIFTACIGYLISYEAASVAEKKSRNKYGLDEDGNPICSEITEEDI